MTSVSAAWGRDAKVIGLVCFPHMMSHFYYTVWPPMAVAVTAAFGISYLEFGVVITCFALAAGIGQTPIGFLVDRIGGRRVLIAGVIIEAGGIGCIALADQYWQLIALALVAGLGHTVYHPADYAIMSAGITKARLGRAFAFHSFSGYVGFALAPILMTEVESAADWRIAFLLAGALGLISALLLVWQGQSLSADTVGGRAGPKGQEGPADERKPLGVWDGFKLLVSFPILMCFLYFVLHQFGGGGLRNFLPAALHEMYGTPEVVGGRVLSIFMIGSALGILFGGFVADRFGPRILTAALTLIPAALFISLIGWYALPLTVLGAVLAAAGFLIGLLVPSRDILLRSVTPDGSMGKVMGFVSTGANFGGALIPVLLGYLMDVKAFSWIFWLSAIFVGVAFLTFATVRGRQRSGQPRRA